jgi:predicted RNase H-like HicB family nuclease
VTKTLAYSLVIDAQAGESGYLAYFPSLPGCHTWGRTHEEAVKYAEEALIGYLEALQINGQALPQEAQLPGDISLGVMVKVPMMA